MKIAEVKYTKNVTKFDIINFIYDTIYKNGWKTSFNYQYCKPHNFTSQPLTITNGSQNEFKKYIDYSFFSSRFLTKKDEAARYKKKYGTSIYYSVVLYWLLVHFGILNKDKLKYCQGYFSYLKKDLLHRNPRHRAGMHAWLSYDKCILDVTIWQQEDCFNFHNHSLKTPIVLGVIPKGLNYVGYEEKDSLVKEYGRRFAKDAGLTFYDWINFHKERADRMYEIKYPDQHLEEQLEKQ